MWNRAMRPALLYGAEVVVYSKKWIKALEVAQNKVARWITGTSQQSARAGLRGEMGWRKMETEIWEKKLGYYGTVKEMDEERLPKIILNKDELDPVGSAWLQDVRTIMQRIGVAHTGQSRKVWGTTVKNALKQWEKQTWLQDRDENSKLGEYPKEEFGQREEYLDFSRKSKILCKFRIGDIGIRDNSQTCGACQEEVNDLRTHILVECVQVQDVRGNGGWGVGNINPGTPGWLRLVLGQEGNVARVQKLGDIWRERGGNLDRI